MPTRPNVTRKLIRHAESIQHPKLPMPKRPEGAFDSTNSRGRAPSPESAPNAAQPKGDKMEKKEKTAFEIYLEIFRSELPLGESFDLLERKLRIGGRRASVFFVDGLHDSEK